MSKGGIYLVIANFIKSVKNNVLVIVLYTFIAVISAELLIYLQLDIYFNKVENREIFYIVGFVTSFIVSLFVLCILSYKKDTYEKELQELNSTLEQKVKQQTIKLTEQNEELKETNKMFKEAEKIAKLGFWSYDIKNDKLYWSDEIYNIFELDKNKFKPTYEHFLNTIHPEDRNKVNDAYLQCVNERKPYTIIHKLLLKNGEVKYVKEQCVNVYEEKTGEALFSNGTVQDITVQYLQEQDIIQKDKQLIEQSKLLAMSDLIKNIGHQYRQPLSVISTATSGMLVKKEFNTLSDEEFVDNCNIIINSVNHLSKTIDSFSAFIEVNKQGSPVPLLSLISNTMEDDNVNLIVNIDKDIHINKYSKQLSQIVYNIFENAIEAFEENGVLDKYVFADAYENDGVISIIIKDNAGGIEDNHINRLFEPYFTTKHQSQGKGLGLDFVYRYLNNIGGTINAGNQEYEFNGKNYKGAEFKITLPLN